MPKTIENQAIHGHARKEELELTQHQYTNTRRRPCLPSTGSAHLSFRMESGGTDNTGTFQSEKRHGCKKVQSIKHCSDF